MAQDATGFHAQEKASEEQINQQLPLGRRSTTHDQQGVHRRAVSHRSLGARHSSVVRPRMRYTLLLCALQTDKCSSTRGVKDERGSQQLPAGSVTRARKLPIDKKKTWHDEVNKLYTNSCQSTTRNNASTSSVGVKQFSLEYRKKLHMISNYSSRIGSLYFRKCR